MGMSKALPLGKNRKMRKGSSLPFQKRESDREAELMCLNMCGSELQIKRGLRGACVQKEREPIHIYRVTDNTQIGQMSEDTRGGTQFRGMVETLL